MSENKINREYEVLTPTGWSNFSHIKQISSNDILRIVFDDNTSIRCTHKHKLKHNESFIEAEWVYEGMVLSGKKVKRVVFESSTSERVYDLVNVDKKNEYYTNDIISHNCEFQGSAGTLISGYVLKSLTFKKPKIVAPVIDGLVYFQEPVEGRTYVIICDTARGKGLDYSAFVVIDVSDIPYRIVARYKNNEVSPIVFPSIINRIGRLYNQAYALVEINDNGQQIVDSLFDDFEYENILSTVIDKQRVTLSWSVGGRKSDRGIRTTKSVKRLGCSLLKSLVESYKIIIEDFEIISELSTFINKGNSYEADDGSHDDLVMCLVLFSWMTNQPFFADICNMNIKDRLYREQMSRIEEDMLPIPMSSEDFLNSTNRIVEDGVVWDIVN